MPESPDVGAGQVGTGQGTLVALAGSGPASLAPRLMIDLHCHVLPGIDDGPETLEQSLELCRFAEACGTTQIVATPHVNWDYPKINAAVMHGLVAELNVELGRAGCGLRIRPGAEIGLSRVGELGDGELGVLKLAGRGPLLIEAPRSGSEIEPALAQIFGRGFNVMLAHPERSEPLQRRPDTVRRLVAGGVLMCVSADSLSGANGRSAQETAWSMLAEGSAHALASDAHNTSTRTPDLVDKLFHSGLGRDAIEYYTITAPRCVIAGMTPPAPPPVEPPRSSGFKRLWGRVK